MIELYTAAVPNGWKISIALQEMGLDYKVIPINSGERVQKQDWYLNAIERYQKETVAMARNILVS